MEKQESYASIIWRQFLGHRIGAAALGVVVVFTLVGIYAPFLASSKPLAVNYNGTWYFPLFRYLFFPGFFTKRLDIFFNLLMFTLPVALILFRVLQSYLRAIGLALLAMAHTGLFFYLVLGHSSDPASDPKLNLARQRWIQKGIPAQTTDPLLSPLPNQKDWERSLGFENDYSHLNDILRYRQSKRQHEILQQYVPAFSQEAKEQWLNDKVRQTRAKMLGEGVPEEMLPSPSDIRAKALAEATPEEQAAWSALPTLWQTKQTRDLQRLEDYREQLEETAPRYEQALADLKRLTGLYRPKSLALDHALEELRNARAKREPKGAEVNYSNIKNEIAPLKEELMTARSLVLRHEKALAEIQYIQNKRYWREKESEKIFVEIMPLLRPFHWEDDAGGEQDLNRYLDWWHLTRINRKDLVAGLIFGVRVSLVVGLTAVGIALLIAIPFGASAGYFGGRWDIFVCRFIEIWESLPTFFMLLMVVAVTQSKSIFLVVAVLGIFGWTGFSRFLRGEFLKQRNLTYVEACHALGFSNTRIILSHILPNAVPPLLTLLPFAILGSITAEAGLSFLGLGEEGSCSWGVLMDEGRQAFPGESYLLWPPAIMLTAFLVAIALVGDALRDAIDPKMRR